MSDNTILSQEQLSYALKKVHIYSELLCQEMPEGSFESPVVWQGLMADFNSEEEKKAKKTLIATAIETVYNNEQISDENKENEAVLFAREVLEMFDFVKLESLKMTPWERIKRLKAIAMARRATRLLLAKPESARLLSFVSDAAHIVHVFLDEKLTLDTQVALCIMLCLVPKVWLSQIYNEPRVVLNQAISDVGEMVKEIIQNKVDSWVDNSVRRSMEEKNAVERSNLSEKWIMEAISEKQKQLNTH